MNDVCFLALLSHVPIESWTAPAPKYKRGWLARYTKMVTNASNGAILE
jgi:dihydroxyacid dehydratase/phosphogluconate dehydratase